MASISPAELSARLSDDNEIVVLDVQRPEDYADWHVPGSLHLDLQDELRSDEAAAKAALSTISTDATVVVSCTAGAPAERAAGLLGDLGYDVRTLSCHRP